METATGIAEEIGLSEIKINYRCSEWLRQEFYPEESPIDTILINDREAELISQQFLKSIRIDHTIEYKAELEKAYPEQREDVIDRIEKLGCALASDYRNSQMKVAHIVVTHGINVRTLGQLAYDQTLKTNIMQPKIENQFDIPYTGISAARIKGDAWEIVLGGAADHLNNDCAEQFLKLNK